MKSIKYIINLLLIFFCINNLNAQKKIQKEVLEIIQKVNNYWQENHSPEQSAFWDEAAYHTGNMAVYQLTRNIKYKQYSAKWANYNHWQGATSTNKKEWKYNYGETQDHVLFGDWQICFQTYIDLYNLDSINDPKKIARAIEVMEYEISTPNKDYWWWVDGLYMVMPVMAKLYNTTKNSHYLDKLYDYWQHSNSIMYDSSEQLYYRDAKYIYPKHKTINGKKDFWSRGDGWAFAAFAKVLTDLPKSDVHRKEYINAFIGIANAIKPLQQSEGYWSRSLLDEQMAPGAESSGTSFYTYGLFWGINHGILSKKEFLPTALKAWQFLSTNALQENGKIGYVQPIGERAIPGQVVDKNSTTNFGVGAFLLAASEYYTYLNKRK